LQKNYNKVKINDNEYTSSQFEIRREENKSQKSESHTQSNLTFFETENITSLNEEEKLSCEGIVSEDECLRALNEFKIVNPVALMAFLRSFTNFFGQKSVPI